MVCILTAWMGKSAGAAIRTAATTRPPPTHLLLLKDDKIDPWQPMRQSVAPNELFHCYFCSFTYEQVNCNATNDYVGEITIWPRIIVTTDYNYPDRPGVRSKRIKANFRPRISHPE
jgi:hypothetical protein